MKRLQDIPTATGNRERGDGTDEWEKDRLIHRLESEGQKTISVDRAVVVIQQCEPQDTFPQGWSANLLVVTIYADPDSGFGGSDEVYIHAGRAGAMDLFLKLSHGPVMKLVPLPEEDARNLSLLSAVARVSAIARLVRKTLTGHYEVLHPDKLINVRSDGTEARADVANVEYDEDLEKLGKEVGNAIDAYESYLRARPNVFINWRKPPKPV